MNKKFSAVLCVFLLTVILALFAVGCEQNGAENANVDKTPRAITVIEKHTGDYVIGEDIDLSEIKFAVRYSDKSTETVTLTDNMLSEEDRKRFLVVGVHTVTITYLGITCPLQISVVEGVAVQEFKATFFSLGGSQINSVTTDVMTAFPVPEREGYIFDGWFVNVEFSDVDSDASFTGERAREPFALSKDTSFYAKWLDKRVCNVTFICDTDIVLPLTVDWGKRVDSDRLQIGDTVGGYVTDENGDYMGMRVTRQGANIILPLDVELWKTADRNDIPVAGDVVVGYQQNREKKNIGLIIRRADVVLNVFEIHYGEKFDVTSVLFPEVDENGHGIVIEGKEFVSWNVTNGNANKVTTNLIVRASFKTDQCTVSIYYFDSNNTEIHSEFIRDYGTPFIYSDYVMPTKEGYTTRWVVYYNHAKKYVCSNPQCNYSETTDHKDNLNCPKCGQGVLLETGFEEMPDKTGVVILKSSYTLIQPYHVVDTYEIRIKNGKPSQDNDKLRSGNIELDFVYEDAEAEKFFTVDWNGTFDYTKYTQEPKLVTPVVVHEGYTAQWCYVVTDENDNQVWYNTKGQIWSDAEEAFMEPERNNGEGESYWLLYDAQGNYIATIRNGIPTEIRKDLNLFAKYRKKDRTVNLRRTYESVRGVIIRLTIPFYDDFSMFDPLTYSDPERYALAPEKVSDSDPSPDAIMQDKIGLYDKVRLYELYQAREDYETLKAMIADNCWSDGYGVTLEEVKLLIEYCDCSGFGKLLATLGRTTGLTENSHAQLISGASLAFDNAEEYFLYLTEEFSTGGGCSHSTVSTPIPEVTIDSCDCNVFSTVLQNGGSVAGIGSRSSSTTMEDETLTAFDTVAAKFHGLLGTIDTTETEWQNGFSARDYDDFIDAVSDLMGLSKISAGSVSSDQWCLFGVNKPYGGGYVVSNWGHDELLQYLIAPVFGYSDVSLFTAYAQNVADSYAAYTAGERYGYDGAVYTTYQDQSSVERHSLIFPFTLENRYSGTVYAFVIIDEDVITVWVSDILALYSGVYSGRSSNTVVVRGRCALFETPRWVVTPGAQYDLYNDFYNKASALFAMANGSVTSGLSYTLSSGALIGISGRYTLSTVAVPTYAVCLNLISKLFGYENPKVFVQYAGNLARTYRTNNAGASLVGFNRTVYDGTVFTRGGSFLLPYVFKCQGKESVLALVIIDPQSNVSVWLSDLDAAADLLNAGSLLSEGEYANVSVLGRCKLFEISRDESIVEDQFGAQTKKDDFVKFYIWLALNYKDYDLLIDLCKNGAVDGTYNLQELKTAVRGTFGVDIYEKADFIGLIDEYKTLLSTYGEGLYSWNNLEALTDFYNRYITIFTNYGLGYESDIFTRDISFAGVDIDECKAIWYYYGNSTGYKFYRLQQDHSDKKTADYGYAEKYQYDYSVLYASDPIEYADYAEYSKYLSYYNVYKNNPSYLYYYSGLELEEGDDLRKMKLLLVSREDLVRFYQFKDTNERIQDLSSFYLIENGQDDWAIEWYRTAELQENGYLDFVNDTFTVTVDTNIYCKDIDNRRYELTFCFDYDFETEMYNENLSFSVVNWASTHYYTLDLTEGKFLPATSGYDATAEYYNRDPENYYESNAASYSAERWNYYKKHVYILQGSEYVLPTGDFNQSLTYYAYNGVSYEEIPTAQYANLHGSIWALTYSYFYTYDVDSGSYVPAGGMFDPTQTYYSNYRPIDMSADINLPDTYDDNVTRVKNGVILNYEFIGWFDVPYYTYLLTGYRGNSLRVVASHSENVTYYAHYACDTTYTITIYDTTQSFAYAGIKEYSDGYAVEDNTIKYTLPAGSILSLSDIYKGMKIDERTVVSGQEYYRQKRYIDYFDAFYDVSDPTKLYARLLSGSYVGQTFVGRAEAVRYYKKVVQSYKKEIEMYENILKAVQDQTYHLYTEEEYEYYLSLYTSAFTKSIDEYLVSRQAFVMDYLTVLSAIYDGNFVDVSSLTSECTDFLAYLPRFKKSTGLARIYRSEWAVYYKNFYVLEGDAYVPASAVFNTDVEYYTFVFTSDYEYDCILVTILEQYIDFMEQYTTYQSNYDSYRLNPKHLYENSMNDLNAASDFDYEGAGELKYNFINWYLDSAYTTPFLDVFDDEYYLANEEAFLDSATWAQVYSRYHTFDPMSGQFVPATSTYDANEKYFLYERDAFYSSDAATFAADKWNYYKRNLYLQNGLRYELVTGDYDSSLTYYTYDGVSYIEVLPSVHATYSGSIWSVAYTNFYTYDDVARKYVPATAVYDENAVYYSKYKDVTSIIVSHLGADPNHGGWSSNYIKYFFKVETEDGYKFVKVESVAGGDVYDETKQYYLSSEMYMSLIVQKDLVLYAKWMDISRGSEGLVYELVTDRITGEKYYVVIDYVNQAQSKSDGYYDTQDYYYVTTNDNGVIPELIVQEGDTISLQIPATITGYKEATAAAALSNTNGTWSTDYTAYYVYNKRTFTYEPADKTFHADYTYYDCGKQVDYRVVGIAKQALSKYKEYITEVNLPLDLYFIEEGAFDLCPIVSYTRAKPRMAETPEDIITVHSRNEIGIALYQDQDCPFDLIGGDGVTTFTYPAARTMLAYAVANTLFNAYTVKDDTLRVGNSVFRNANSLLSISFGDSPVVTEIGDYAFSGSKIFAFSVYPSVIKIGDSAFENAQSLGRVNVLPNSSLQYIGKAAFSNTAWFKAQRGIVKMSWSTSSGNTGAIVGINVPAAGGYVYYDKTTSGAESYTTVYNENGEVDPASQYYAISNGVDKILYKCVKDNISGTLSDPSLYGLIINTKVAILSDHVFDVSLSFVSVTIVSDNLEYVGKGAFWNCVSLETVKFVHSDGASIHIAEISEDAFSGCGSLSSIYFDGDLSKWLAIDFKNETANPLYYASNLYLNGVLLTGALAVPGGTTEIKANAFVNYAKIESVSIGTSVTRIGSNAFAGCESLTLIQYGGTGSSWENNVIKGDNWDEEMGGGHYTVECTDGNLYY